MTAGVKCYSLRPGCGYGDAACQYLAGLDALTVPVSWHPLQHQLDETPNQQACTRALQAGLGPILNRLWQRESAYDSVLISLPPVDWYSQIIARESGKRIYAYVAWELEQLPAEWTSLLNQLHALMVPSQFVAAACRRSGVCVPIHVIPHVCRQFDKDTTLPEWAEQFSDDYMFYTMATWTSRKAIELTVKAYLDRFCSSDPVCLVIKTDAVNYMAQAQIGTEEPANIRTSTGFTLANLLAHYPDPAKIHLLNERLGPAAMDALHTRGDCFVSLTRSEGWGLASFDALQHGKPVIMPGFGGQVDYLGADYPLLVDFNTVTVADVAPDNFFHGEDRQQWSAANTRHAGELMANMVADPTAGKLLAQELCEKIKRHYSPEVVCLAMAGAMEVTNG